jgi:hypothetical protein
MAQADSVPSSTRQLITGESANQSTNLRALNLPAVRVKPVDRRYFISGSDARVIMGTDEAPLLPLWRERQGGVEPEALLNRRWYGANTRQVPVNSNIEALFYATAVFFLRWLPRSILLILLRFLRMDKRSHFNAFDQVSSNQLARSKPQGRLR